MGEDAHDDTLKRWRDASGNARLEGAWWRVGGDAHDDTLKRWRDASGNARLEGARGRGRGR